MCFICRATFGRCSLILMPGTLVAISLKGPPLAWPGFKSKVSICEGPPLIHSRIQERLRSGCDAVWAASDSSQPDMEAPRTPAVDRRSQSRRDRDGRRVMGESSGFEPQRHRDTEKK